MILRGKVDNEVEDLNDPKSLIPHLFGHRTLERDEMVRTVQLRRISGHALFVLLGNLIGSLALVTGLWSQAPNSWLLGWLFIMMLLNSARWLTNRQFPRGQLETRQLQRWENFFIISVTLSGMLWGLAGGLFYPFGDAEQRMFIAVIIVGICAATTTTLSYHRFAFFLFLLLAIPPLTIRLVMDASATANTIGYVIPFYFLLLCTLSRKLYITTSNATSDRISSKLQAMQDHLTGIANRRAFDEVMSREWLRSLRNNRPLALIIADIDNFKACNDRYGHPMGDKVLEAIAALLESRIRRGADLAARIGGEEFAVLLPETDLTGAIYLAEEIRASTEALHLQFNNELPKQTLSLGVASLTPTSDMDSRLLFFRADEAVYQAKRSGKNRVETVGKVHKHPAWEAN